jgi:hypothetical protein
MPGFGLQAELSANALQQGDAQGDAAASGQGYDGEEVLGASVDLGVGLAAHTYAMLKQRQAMVAGMPLGAINAKLEEFALEHVWDADGSLADFSSIASSVPGGPSRPAPSVQGGEHGGSPPHRPSGPSGAFAGGLPPPPPSVAGGRPGSPGGRSATASVTATGKRDYLREEREAKELTKQ